MREAPRLPLTVSLGHGPRCKIHDFDDDDDAAAAAMHLRPRLRLIAIVQDRMRHADADAMCLFDRYRVCVDVNKGQWSDFGQQPCRYLYETLPFAYIPTYRHTRQGPLEPESALDCIRPSSLGLPPAPRDLFRVHDRALDYRDVDIMSYVCK